MRISTALTLDVVHGSAQEIADCVRDALLELGGQTYVDQYARDVKRTESARPPAGHVTGPQRSRL